MFGYIRPLEAELKVRDFELYKAVYCGLCKSLGKNISIFAKFTLSYDIVFLALIRFALTGEASHCMSFRCKLKPAKKRRYVTTEESPDFSNNCLLYCACVSAVLVYYKCLDDIYDTKNPFKRLLKRICLPFFDKMRKKALKKFPMLDGLIRTPFNELNAAESEKHGSIDSLSSYFGELLAGVCEYGIENVNLKMLASVIGKNIGRWLYIIDALDDFRKDLKNNEFNVFGILYSNTENLKNDIDMIKTSLNLTLNEVYTAALLLDDSPYNALIDNIVRLGLLRVQENITGNHMLTEENENADRPLQNSRNKL